MYGKQYNTICFKNFSYSCSILKTEMWCLGVFQINEDSIKKKKTMLIPLFIDKMYCN